MGKMVMLKINENAKKRRIVKLKQLFAENHVNVDALTEEETDHLLAAVLIALR